MVPGAIVWSRRERSIYPWQSWGPRVLATPMTIMGLRANHGDHGSILWRILPPHRSNGPSLHANFHDKSGRHRCNATGIAGAAEQRRDRGRTPASVKFHCAGLGSHTPEVGPKNFKGRIHGHVRATPGNLAGRRAKRLLLSVLPPQAWLGDRHLTVDGVLRIAGGGAHNKVP